MWKIKLKKSPRKQNKKTKKVEKRRVKLRILEHQSSSSKIPKTGIQKENKF